MNMPYLPPLNQAEAEHATGLSREVLRKWEIRYQFPTPERGERGRRLYSQADVQRLQLIARLVYRGVRPHKIVTMPLPELQDLLACWSQDSDAAAHEAGLLECLAPGCAPHALQDYLNRLMNENGLAKFAQTLLPAFNEAVGTAWASGRLGVHMEHLYTEGMRQTLYLALAKLRPSTARPRVLITTPPGELHGLGAMGLQVALALQGATCISLGTQTPADAVAQAVTALDIGVVAISASVCLQPEDVLHYLTSLRQALPTECRLWVGGRGTHPLLERLPQGVEQFGSVDLAVDAWQLLLQN